MTFPFQSEAAERADNLLSLRPGTSDLQFDTRSLAVRDGKSLNEPERPFQVFEPRGETKPDGRRLGAVRRRAIGPVLRNKRKHPGRSELRQRAADLLLEQRREGCDPGTQW